VRSQRRFGGMVSQERLESALTELLKAGEMNARRAAERDRRSRGLSGSAMTWVLKMFPEPPKQWQAASGHLGEPGGS
jgi:hypothetical protein